MHLFAFLLACGLAPVAPSATVTVNTAAPAGTSQLRLGVTHTQVYWEYGNATAVARARSLLQPVASIQNQSIMGWGAGLIQASQGAAYDFSTLDARVNVMNSLGTNLALTLCTAPGWMKTTGQDWNMEDRVADNRVSDFAALCSAVAQRYTTVHSFVVWNEMKGYWSSAIRNSDGSYGNWDYAKYTSLYNAVYAAIKAVRPDAEVGGCYVPLLGDASNTLGYSGAGTETPVVARDLDCFNYWLANKMGADFICMDRWLAGWNNPNSLTEADQLKLTWTYRTVVQAIRARTTLPIWYSEYYTAKYNVGGSAFEACANASIYYWMIKGAGSTPVTALLWNPAEGESLVAHYLFTSTSTSSGGQPTPHYPVFKAFDDYFGPGTQLYEATSSDTNIEVLASSTKTLLINKHNSLQMVSVNGMVQELPAYAVRVLDTPHLIPAAPSGLSAVVGSERVSLTWNSSAGATNYIIQRSTVSGGSFASVAYSSGTTWLDIGLTNGSTYYYVVAAVGAGGQSTNSAQVAATPSTPVPVVWFKADEINGYTNGAKLGTWDDSSGNTHPATNASFAQQPIYLTSAINGLPGVRFTAASSNWLAFARPVQDDFTLIAVFQSTQGVSTDTLFWQGAGLVSGEVNGPTNDFGISLNASGKLLAGTGNPIPPDDTVVSASEFNDGLPHVFTFTRRRASGALALYVDGTLAATATGTTNSLTAPARLVLGGQQTLTNFLSGDIAQVKIFSSPLLDWDRHATERALANKYAISGDFGTNLPPRVGWQTPTNNSVFFQPMSLLLSVSADDPDGSVAQVEFFDGTNLLGTVHTPPYNLSWHELPSGCHSLWARSTDDRWTTSDSTSVSIMVQPLTLEILQSSQPGTQLTFQFQGQIGQDYYLESSTDLVHWLRVLTNTPTTELTVFPDTNSMKSKCFYRLSQ